MRRSISILLATLLISISLIPGITAGLERHDGKATIQDTGLITIVINRKGRMSKALFLHEGKTIIAEPNSTINLTIGFKIKDKRGLLKKLVKGPYLVLCCVQIYKYCEEKKRYKLEHLKIGIFHNWIARQRSKELVIQLRAPPESNTSQEYKIVTRLMIPRYFIRAVGVGTFCVISTDDRAEQNESVTI